MRISKHEVVTQEVAHKTKKAYLSPEITVIEVEMEEGVASGSATVTPVEVNGNTDTVSTDWGGSDTTTIDTPF